MVGTIAETGISPVAYDSPRAPDDGRGHRKDIMSDQSTTQPDIFNILVEQGAGTGNYVSRETYTGTEDDVRQYAQNIANAEGGHVRVTKTTGDEVGVFEPHAEGDGQS